VVLRGLVRDGDRGSLKHERGARFAPSHSSEGLGMKKRM
jgi:hypothetical protein